MQIDKELIVPIFEHIGQDISIQIQRDDSAKYLFCTRAGYALKRLLNLCGHQTTGRESLFAISRLTAAKVAFHRSPETFIEICIENFNHTTLGFALAGLLPQEFLGQRSISKACHASQIDLNQVCTYNALRAALNPDMAIGKLLREHLAEQYHGYHDYLTSLIGDMQKIVLIDSGWRGTSQYLLQLAFPQWRFYGYYVGMDQPKSALVAHRSHGILTAGDRFKNLMKHHHIFENLFEPKIASTAYLTVSKGGWYVNGELNTWLLDQCVHLESIYAEEFNAVCQHIPQALSVAKKAKALEKALQILERIITEPSVEVAKNPIFNTGARTADFGKSDNLLPVITKPYALRLRNREDRLSLALWKEGQLAVEQVVPDSSKLTRAPQRFQSVCVVTRTKNRPLLLKRAMQSVTCQTYPHLHWVVINDGGNQEEVEQVLDHCALASHKMTVLHNSVSLGMEASSNKAINAVSSDLISIHDDDDAWEPEFLRASINFLNESAHKLPNIYGVVTHAWRVNEYLFETYAQSLEKIGYKDWYEYVAIEHMAKENLFAPIQFVFARDIYDRINGFNEQLPVLGDWDFNLRFLMHAEIVVLTKKLAYYYHRDYQQQGVYANSVYDGIDQHAFYGNMIRNNAFRHYFNDSLSAAIINTHLKS